MRQATDQALPLVMVTGASSGIGKALAMAFAREGHPLLLISRHIEPIAGLPEDTVYRQADVADYGAITAAVDAAIAVHGPVGCLVNNAGMADARAFEEVDEPSYARELDTNLKGVFNCTQAVRVLYPGRRLGAHSAVVLGAADLQLQVIFRQDVSSAFVQRPLFRRTCLDIVLILFSIRFDQEAARKKSRSG